jgi:hypothetical protein
MGTTPVIIDPLHPSELSHHHEELRAAWSHEPRSWRLPRRRATAVAQPACCAASAAA